MSSVTEDNYAILGLPDEAPIEDVKKAFQRLKREIAESGDWKRLKQVSLAYEALVATDTADAGTQHSTTMSVRDTDPGKTVIDRLFPAQEKVNVFFFAGRCIVFALIFIAGVRLMINLPSSELAGHSFFHNISLPFHEAGHILFGFLGDFLRTLGGSIMQVLVPVVCLIAFMKKHDVFGASFALWWTGQNFIDMGPYIYDARAQELMLIGGVTGRDVPGYHDWNNILGQLGLLKLDHAIANMSHFFGCLLMTAAFAWCGIVLYMQYKNLDR